MANILSYVSGIKQLVGLGNSTQAVDVPAVEVHHVETNPDRRARCLKHLLKANHINYSIIRLSKDGRQDLPNDLPHALSSAYFLGATVQQLNAAYDQEIKGLAGWEQSPAELDEDWLDVKGDVRYARAYVDFFEDKLADSAYDWKKVVMNYLFFGPEPLFNGLASSEGSALIRLAYAFELDSKELGMEALGQAGVQYSSLGKYLNNPASTKSSPLAKGTVEELLGHIRGDERFQRLQSSAGAPGDDLSSDQEQLLLEYWNAWDLQDPTAQFEISQKAVVTAILTTNRPKQNTFDPGLAQILITSHAVRTLIPFLPAEFHVPLLRQWWLFTLAVILQRGGLQKSEYGLVIDTAGKDWKYVQHQVINSLLPRDVLGVQVVQAIQETAATWGDNRSQSLAAAVTFVDNLKSWA